MCGFCFVVFWAVVVWFFGVGVLGFGVGLVFIFFDDLGVFFNVVWMAIARLFQD
jgi:hypothetical protein